MRQVYSTCPYTSLTQHTEGHTRQVYSTCPYTSLTQHVAHIRTHASGVQYLSRHFTDSAGSTQRDPRVRSALKSSRSTHCFSLLATRKTSLGRWRVGGGGAKGGWSGVRGRGSGAVWVHEAVSVEQGGWSKAGRTRWVEQGG